MARTYRSRKAKTTKKTDKRSLTKLVRNVMLRQAEDKHFYVNSGTTAVTYLSSAAIIPLTQIGQGVSDNERIGDQIRLNKLRLHIRLVAQASNILTVFRFIVFRYKPLATVTMPYPLQENLSLDYQSSLSHYDHKLVPSQMVILKDVIEGGIQPYTNPFVRRYVINLKNVEQVYTGATYSTNAIYLLLIGMSTTSTSSYVFNSEIQFNDI